MTIEETSGPELIVQHTGQVFPLGTTDVAIGSQEDNTIILADPSVSPHHVIIFWQADTGAHFINDLGSDEGTYINGVRLEAPRMLRHGDAIRMGNTVLELKRPPSPDPAFAGTPPPLAAEGAGSSSKSPIWAGILIAILAGAAIICMALFVIVLLTGGKGTPAVTIQSPAAGAQIGIGNELVLQATASGAKDITLLELRVDGSLVATASDPNGTSSLTVNKAWLFTTPGEHVISADAYTASDKTSRPASVKVTVLAAGAGQTPTAEPDQPTDTPTPTVTPSPTPEDTVTPTPTSVPPPQVEYFQASPASISAGNCTTLQWGKVSNATEANIEPGLGGVGTPGSETVCPLETTTYILTAKGPGGTTQASATVTVIGGLPDLTIDSISFIPSPPLAEQENEVQITIRNAGIGVAGAFDWEWQAGSDATFDGRIYGLGAGETNVVTLLWSPARPYDSLTTEARVDVNDEVLEKDEDNNRYAAVVQVVEAEVEPVTVTLTSESAIDGYRLNDGTGSSARDILVGNGELVNPTGELVARGFMSFDLSDIPEGATIESAELRFYQKEIQGSPYQKLGNVVLEHIYYGASLDDSAYNTPALGSAALDMETSPKTWYILSDPTIVAWVQSSLETGLMRQQYRLQFSQETDGDGQEDWIAIQGGGGILGSREAPQMIITYIP
jgi:hypothetical protein